MRILITCGPSFEPIDQVRRLTNLSTGELGVRLATRLAQDQHHVLCLKSRTATHPNPAPPVALEYFTTNDDLQQRLEQASSRNDFRAVFHVAALCDFRVDRILDPTGSPRTDGKIPSHTSGLVVHLVPARKLIGDLRRLFPQAWIAGWKYEVDGTLNQAVERGHHQIAAQHTDACIVNGPACRGAFIVCLPSHRTQRCEDRPELADFLASTIASLEIP